LQNLKAKKRIRKKSNKNKRKIGSVEILFFRGNNQIEISTKCVCIYRSTTDISGK